MTLFNWSTTAASNSTADATINWAEGQAPSTVNDSARALMAAMAKYRDDMSGKLATAGTSTAITITTNQVYTSLTDGISVVARITTTNGAAPTLAVDGLTARAIQRVSGTAIGTGELLAGSIHRFTYRLSTTSWIVSGLTATVPAAASAAEQEAGTATTVYVAPGTQHRHPGHAKSWGVADAAGTASASYNVASVDDNGTGDIDFNYTTGLSSGNFCALGTAQATVTTPRLIHVNSRAANFVQFNCSNAGTAVDPTNYYMQVQGDMA